MKRYIGGVAALALLLAGCGSDNEAAPASKCTASGAIAAAIAKQLNDGVAISGMPQAFRSPDYKSVYIVAVNLTGAGAGGSSAIFAVNELTAPTTIFSVDAVASAISKWPSGSGQDLSVNSTGVAEAKACL